MSAKIMMLPGVVIVCLLVVSAIVAAPNAPTADYTIAWWTVDGGGGGSNGEIYALNGTSGQADAQTSSGGIYALTGGFWNEGVVSPYRAYLPVILK